MFKTIFTRCPNLLIIATSPLVLTSLKVVASFENLRSLRFEPVYVTTPYSMLVAASRLQSLTRLSAGLGADFHHATFPAGNTIATFGSLQAIKLRTVHT